MQGDMQKMSETGEPRQIRIALGESTLLIENSNDDCEVLRSLSFI
jgi:hypothetical protein